MYTFSNYYLDDVATAAAAADDDDDATAGVLGSKWLAHSGGDRSDKCGVLLSGSAMQFSSSAERLLETSDLNLLHSTLVMNDDLLSCC